MKKSKKEVKARETAKRARAFRVGMLACALLLAGVAAYAAKYNSRTSEPERAAVVQAAPAKAEGNFVTVEVGGKKLRVNAQTLQQGPLTQEQSQQIADALEGNKSTAGLVEVQHADGTVSMDLQGRFQNVTVAKKNDDGSVSAACVDTPEAARSFLQTNTTGKTVTVGAGASRKGAVRE
jgi:hypothetical protein